MGYLKTEGGGRGSSEPHESPLGPLCRGNINIDVHVLVCIAFCFKQMAMFQNHVHSDSWNMLQNNQIL